MFPEDVPNDLLFMNATYNWLYSKPGSNIVAKAEEGDANAKYFIDKLELAIKTIEFWQLNDRFDRAHYEVNKLREWFKPRGE